LSQVGFFVSTADQRSSKAAKGKRQMRTVGNTATTPQAAIRPARNDRHRPPWQNTPPCALLQSAAFNPLVRPAFPSPSATTRHEVPAPPPSQPKLLDLLREALCVRNNSLSTSEVGLETHPPSALFAPPKPGGQPVHTGSRTAVRGTPPANRGPKEPRGVSGLTGPEQRGMLWAISGRTLGSHLTECKVPGPSRTKASTVTFPKGI
jgi:hypothetical protein